MAKTFMPSFENLDELRQHQLKGLQWTVNHAYRGSSLYREKLEAAGVESAENYADRALEIIDALRRGLDPSAERVAARAEEIRHGIKKFLVQG